MCHSMSVEVRGQPVGIDSDLLPCGSQGWNSGRQCWWQVTLPTEPSRQPLASHLVPNKCPSQACHLLDLIPIVLPFAQYLPAVWSAAVLQHLQSLLPQGHSPRKSLLWLSAYFSRQSSTSMWWGAWLLLNQCALPWSPYTEESSLKLCVVAHSCNTNTWKAGRFLLFATSMGYILSSNPAWVI